jgi:hypothetical protein
MTLNASFAAGLFYEIAPRQIVIQPLRFCYLSYEKQQQTSSHGGADRASTQLAITCDFFTMGMLFALSFSDAEGPAGFAGFDKPEAIEGDFDERG